MGKLKMKRGNSATQPPLEDGEFAFLRDTGKMIVNSNGRDFEVGVVSFSHAKSGVVHTLVGTMPTTGLVSATFKATADFAEGNTFSINGTAYTAKPNGEELTLPDKAFVLGDVVSVAVDVVGKKINFRVGGGSGFPKSWQQEVTAPAREKILKDDAVMMSVTNSINEELQMMDVSGAAVHTGDVSSVAIRNSDNLLIVGVAGSPKLNFFEAIGDKYVAADSSKYIDIIPNSVARVSLSFDGTLMCLSPSGSTEKPYIYKLINNKYYKQPNLEIYPSNTNLVSCFSPDNEYLIITTVAGFCFYRFNGTTYVKIGATYSYSHGSGIVFTPDGKRAIMAFGVKDASTPSTLCEFTFDNDIVTKTFGIDTSIIPRGDLALSPDGMYLISTYWAGNVLVHKFINGKYTLITSSVVGGGTLTNLNYSAFTVDGKNVAFTGGMYLPPLSIYAFNDGAFTKLPNPQSRSGTTNNPRCGSDGKYLVVTNGAANTADYVQAYNLNPIKEVSKSIPLEEMVTLSKYSFFGLGISLQNASKGQLCKVNLFPPFTKGSL